VNIKITYLLDAVKAVSRGENCGGLVLDFIFCQTLAALFFVVFFSVLFLFVLMFFFSL